MNSVPQRAPVSIVLGMLLTSWTVLVLQIAITRIMSVSVTYHSAFMVLAIVMLGLAASAISVFVRLNGPAPVGLDSVSGAAQRASIAIALAVVAYLTFVSISLGAWYQPIQIIITAAIFYGGFYQCGYVVAYLLSHYARDVSRLYWYDLLGAALGCLIIVPLLNQMSAITLAFLCAVSMALVSLLIANSLGKTKQAIGSLAIAVALSAVALVNHWQPERFRFGLFTTAYQRFLVWEKWNSLAKVSVYQEVPTIEAALGKDATPEQRNQWQSGWGMSPKYTGDYPNYRWIELDSGAGTQIIGRDTPAGRDPKFLQWDVTAAAYWLRPGAPDDVFIIGGGGGRDMLTAQTFGTKRVHVVELNPVVVEAVNQQFGDFAGKPYSDANVVLDIAEARSTLSRNQQKYDVIQMSMIDTFAASVSGSLVLAENTLYTAEAFDLYWSRLKPDGLLSVSRWYNTHQYGELGRVMSLMGQAMLKAGIEKPEDHVAVVLNRGYLATAVITCVMKRSPFNADDRKRLVDLCDKMNFQILWPAAASADKAEAIDIAGVLRQKPEAMASDEFDLAAPTDDRPFFFNTRLPFQSWITAIRTGDSSRGSWSTFILGGTLLFVIVASAGEIIRPLRAFRSTLAPETLAQFQRTRWLMLYFTGIGCGFMFIELALIQRFITFLGHPTYSITVVLFTLLLFSGVGSMLTDRVRGEWVRWFWILPSLGIQGMLLAAAFLLPPILVQTHGQSDAVRIALSIAFVAPFATCLGMMYPSGVRLLDRAGLIALVPWMWGCNGVAAVLSSVIGMWVAMEMGYTAVLLLGMISYLIVAISAWLATRSA